MLAYIILDLTVSIGWFITKHTIKGIYYSTYYILSRYSNRLITY